MHTESYKSSLGSVNGEGAERSEAHALASSSLVELLIDCAQFLVDLAVGEQADLCGLEVDLLEKTVARLNFRAVAVVIARHKTSHGWAHDRESQASVLKEVLRDWPGELQESVAAHSLLDGACAIIQRLCQRSDDFASHDGWQIGSLYENLLAYKLIEERGSARFTRIDTSKRRRGVYYTPRRLAEKTVRMALEPLLGTGKDLKSFRILDPAMGSGVFLLAALDFLTGAQLLQSRGGEGDRSQLMKDLAVSSLYGVDLDPAAVDVARVALWLTVGDFALNPFNSFQNLRCGNALIGAWQDESPDHLQDIEDMTEGHHLDLYCSRVLAADNDRVKELRRRHRFFHWRVEFPQVFRGESPGFDAVVSNPPWEIEKPNAREFFGSYDPSFWELSKQDAMERQNEMLSRHASIATRWQEYLESIDATTRWLKFRTTRRKSNSGAGATRPFQLQGKADINAYKLFIEMGYHLLREGGVMGQIVPSGIYSDKGAFELRRFFMEENRWLSLAGFENRDGAFEIHRSFKYCILVIERGGTTESIDCSFREGARFDYPVGLVKRFSPDWQALVELDDKKDFQVLEKVYSLAIPLGANDVDGKRGALSFSREFDMTNDSHLFAERDEIESGRYVADRYGHWLKGAWRRLDSGSQPGSMVQLKSSNSMISADGLYSIAIDDIESVYLPLYEGRMIGQFESSRKEWVKGKGRRAEWKELPPAADRICPQYLIDARQYKSDPHEAKIGYLGVGSPTNARSMIAACIPDMPCGNSVQVLRWSKGTESSDGNGATAQPGESGEHRDGLTDGHKLRVLLAVTACLNSFVFDYALRIRMTANNLNWFIMEECPLPPLNRLINCDPFIWAVASLSFSALRHAVLVSDIESVLSPEWSKLLTLKGAQERRQVRAVVDALVAGAYGLSEEDYAWILRDCRLSVSELSARAKSLHPKGFHRVDKQLETGERLTVLSAMAYETLVHEGEEPLIRVLASMAELGDGPVTGHPDEWTDRSEIIESDASKIMTLRSL